MKEYRADRVGDSAYDLAEGPRWDDVRALVSWVDIPNGRVFRARLGADSGDEAGGLRVTDRLDFPDTVGSAGPTSDGGLIVAAHDRLVTVASDGTRHATEAILDRADQLRLNDSAVDPAGRLLVGSMATDGRPGAGALFRLEPSGDVVVLKSRLTLANGIGWSPDGTTLYLVDSVPGTLWSASYDVSTGNVHAWAPLVSTFDGLPDGLCVDSAGRIWVAVWGSSRVRCFTPTGDPLAAVHVPAPHVTAAAFVGPAMDRLLITTARVELDDEALARYPDSGGLFLADVHAVGLPTTRWTPPPEHITTEHS